MMKKKSHYAGHSLGIFLIMMGILSAVVIFDLLRLGDPDEYVKWQILLIFLGLLALFDKNGVAGVALIAAGTWFLIPETNFDLPEIFFKIYWPSAFILGGIIIVAGGIINRIIINNRNKN